MAEIAYQIIKKWSISTYTKNLVRYHYLIRDKELATKKGLLNKAKRMQKSFDKLDKKIIEDLEMFMKIDELGKKLFKFKFTLRKKILL